MILFYILTQFSFARITGQVFIRYQLLNIPISSLYLVISLHYQIVKFPILFVSEDHFVGDYLCHA